MSAKPKTGSIKGPHPSPLPEGEGIVVQANQAWLKAIPGLKKAVKEMALAAGGHHLTIRFAENDEVQKLNHQFRGKDKPTNVLSFPLSPGERGGGEGDIILAREVVFQEATAQKKSPLHHTLHLVAHGVLHLLGYDHEQETDAADMEAREIQLLATFGIKNPYE